MKLPPIPDGLERWHILEYYLDDIVIADRGEIPRDEMLQMADRLGVSLAKLYRLAHEHRESKGAKWLQIQKNKKTFKRFRTIGTADEALQSFDNSNQKDNKVLHQKLIEFLYGAPKPKIEDQVSIPPDFSLSVSKFKELFNSFRSEDDPDRMISQTFKVSSTAIKSVRSFLMLKCDHYETQRKRDNEILRFVKYALLRRELEDRIPTYHRLVRKKSLRKEIECIATLFGLSLSQVYRIIGDIDSLKDDVFENPPKTYIHLARKGLFSIDYYMGNG